jgi:hypothetical protein
MRNPISLLEPRSGGNWSGEQAMPAGKWNGRGRREADEARPRRRLTVQSSPPLSLLSVSSATRLLGQAVTAGSGTRSPFHSTDHQNTHPSSVPGSACCVPRVSESVPRAQVLGPCAARAGAVVRASPSPPLRATAAPALSSPVARGQATGQRH